MIGLKWSLRNRLEVCKSGSLQVYESTSPRVVKSPNILNQREGPTIFYPSF